MEEIEPKKSKKTNIIIIVALAIILILIALFTSIKSVKDSKNNKVDNQTEAPVKSISNVNGMTTLIKDYFYENNFVTKDKLDSWNIDSITYVGELNNKHYYKVTGTFSCLDLTSTCLYLPQVEEPQNGLTLFTFYVVTNRQDDSETIDQLLDSLPEELDPVNEPLKNDTELAKDIKDKIEKYYQEHNLIHKDNLDSLEISKVEYVKKDDKGEIYRVEGTYKCKDNTSSCFYVAQESDQSNNKYSFNLYILIKDDTIINIDTILAEETIEDIFIAPKTSEKIIAAVKKYYADNNFVDQSNLASWEITKVTLVGYYDKTMSEKIYKLEGSYSCKDNESDCVYLEQVDDKNADNAYPYTIYATFTAQGDTLKIKGLSGAITNDSLIEINKIVR